jgi:hypothetical protein
MSAERGFPWLLRMLAIRAYSRGFAGLYPLNAWMEGLYVELHRREFAALVLGAAAGAGLAGRAQAQSDPLVRMFEPFVLGTNCFLGT